MTTFNIPTKLKASNWFWNFFKLFDAPNFCIDASWIKKKATKQWAACCSTLSQQLAWLCSIIQYGTIIVHFTERSLQTTATSENRISIRLSCGGMKIRFSHWKQTQSWWWFQYEWGSERGLLVSPFFSFTRDIITPFSVLYKTWLWLFLTHTS